MKKILALLLLFSLCLSTQATERDIAKNILKGENISLDDTQHYVITDLKNYTVVTVFHATFKRTYVIKDDCIYSITEVFYNGMKYDLDFSN